MRSSSGRVWEQRPEGRGRNRLASATMALVIGILAVGCANRLAASPRASNLPCTPPPISPVVTLVTAAHNPALAATCFAVSANTPFQMTIEDNVTAELDGNPSPVQFAIFPNKASAVSFDPTYAEYTVNTENALYTSDLDPQGVVTDTVKGLPAGTYYVLDVRFPAYQGAGFWLIVQ